MVARGGPCGFSDKWAFAQSQGWGGIMVVNNAPGPVDVAGLIPLPVEPTIAFMRLTQAVGDQILSDWRAPGGPVVIEMSVTWTPNPTALPEPGTLLLVAAGLGAALSTAAAAPQRAVRRGNSGAARS